MKSNFKIEDWSVLFHREVKIKCFYLSMRRGALLVIGLTNRERLVRNVKLKGSLHCSDHEIVEFEILMAVRRVSSKLNTLGFRRVDFGLLRYLLGGVS